MKYLFLIISMLPFLANAQITTTMQDGGRFYVVVDGDTVSQHTRVDKAIESASNYPEWDIVQDFRLSGSSFFYDDAALTEVTDTVFIDPDVYESPLLNNIQWGTASHHDSTRYYLDVDFRSTADRVRAELVCGPEHMATMQWIPDRLHDDIMDLLAESDDTEMEYDDKEKDDYDDKEKRKYEDDEEDEEDTEMEEDPNDDMDALRDTVANISSRLEDVEDALSQAMTAEDVDAELEDATGNKLADIETVKTLQEQKEELEQRVEELENVGKESKTLSDAQDQEWEPTYDTTPATHGGW